MPSQDGSWPAFWFFGGDGTHAAIEIDVFDRVGWSGGGLPQEYMPWKFPVNIIDWSNTYTFTEGGNTYTEPTSCDAQIYKQTPCNFSDDWHTFTLVTTPINNVITPTAEIVLFIDEKQAWSVRVTDTDRMPSYTNFKSPVILNLATWGGDYPEADFQIDYFRHYTAASDNQTNIPLFMQNLQSGVAKTLESPDLYIPTHPNNDYLPVLNSSMGTTASISPSCNIASLNSGSGLKLYYKGQNSICYEYSGGYQAPIEACYLAYNSFGPYPSAVRLNDAKNFLTPWHSTRWTTISSSSSRRKTS